MQPRGTRTLADDKQLMIGPTDIAGAAERHLRELIYHVQNTHPLGIDIQASMGVLDKVGDLLEKLHEMQAIAAKSAPANGNGEVRPS